MYCLNTELKSFYLVFIAVYVIFCSVCVYYVSVCNGSSQNLCSRCFETFQKTVVSQDINLPYIFVGSPHQKNVMIPDLSWNQTTHKLRTPCSDIPSVLREYIITLTYCFCNLRLLLDANSATCKFNYSKTLQNRTP